MQSLTVILLYLGPPSFDTLMHNYGCAFREQ